MDFECQLKFGFWTLKYLKTGRFRTKLFGFLKTSKIRVFNGQTSQVTQSEYQMVNSPDLGAIKISGIGYSDPTVLQQQ